MRDYLGEAKDRMADD